MKVPFNRAVTYDDLKTTLETVEKLEYLFTLGLLRVIMSDDRKLRTAEDVVQQLILLLRRLVNTYDEIRSEGVVDI